MQQSEEIEKTAGVKPPTGIVSSMSTKPAAEQVTEQVAPDAAGEKPDPVAPKGTMSEITPELTSVKNDETVAGNMSKLLGSDSKYIQQAKTDAVRNANSRGLINSSIAAGAGTEAAIRNAMPIAQQDASTKADRATLNQNTVNEFKKNEQSADLNMKTEENRVKLETQAQQKLNEQKFTQQTQLEYVTAINSIISNTQAQIVDIGMSDRTADQQAAAIAQVEANRDAAISVYEDLLEGMNDWTWGTDFTPEKAVTDGEANDFWNYPGGGEPPQTEPAVGSSMGGFRYLGGGQWEQVVGSQGTDIFAGEY